MNGRSILFDALDGTSTPRVPWVPFVGVHGGHLIGVDASSYLRSADHIVAGLLEAKRRYRPDGLPVVFDLQLEAEVLGCDLQWADEGPPAVTSHPLAGVAGFATDNLPELDLGAGRFPLVLDATRRLKKEIGDDTALYGLICGPFTLALHLAGNDIFLEMFDDEEAVEALVAFCATIGQQVAQAYIEAGCDVIAVVDPMTSQISPDHFQQFVASGVNAVFDHVHACGARASLFVCGDATRNLAVMCQTNCDNISIDENIDLQKLVDLPERGGKSIGGNLKLTVGLLLGSQDDVKMDTLRCLDAGGDTGFVLAPGCDLPYATPPANLEAVAELVHDDYQRQVARQLTAAPGDDAFDDVPLPDYAGSEAVIVDLITLDSATCAPCQYMVGAAQRAASRFGDRVVVREHKVTGRDGLGYMTKLRVGNIPTICIDGEARFVSIIPDQRTLEEALQQALDGKGGAG